ncbi:hypothetical protein JZ751_020384, partial [Albula glossodonta]
IGCRKQTNRCGGDQTSCSKARRCKQTLFNVSCPGLARTAQRALGAADRTSQGRTEQRERERDRERRRLLQPQQNRRRQKRHRPAAGTPSRHGGPPGMGCSSGHMPFQPPAPPASDQEGALQDGAGPKVPEALSTVERLAQATGGTEKSWYRCVFPFGLISLVIGVAGTGVTFTFNTMPETKAVSVVLLGLGLGMVLLAVACWRIHRVKRRKRKEGGSFSSEQCAL